MKATNRSIFESLNPYYDVRDRITPAATLREWWDGSTNPDDMMWLVGKAHAKGNLSRRRIVQVALRACEVSMHLAPEAVVEPLGRLCDWLDGDDSIDLVSVQDTLQAETITSTSWSAYCATYAAYATAHATTHIAETATHYADLATTNDASAGDDDDEGEPAMTDVIRDAITIDELCAALNLDPEAGV